MENNDIQMPFTKVLSLWALIGITTWTEAAAFAGFVYTILLMAELVWKKWGLRRFAERRGWVRKRRPTDTDMGTLR